MMACAGVGLSLLAAFAAALSCAPGARAQGWSPTGTVEIVSPAGAGGAIDSTARLIERVVREQKLVKADTVVVNKPGGGHSVGYAYINQRPGDGQEILVTSANLVSNAIVGTSAIGFRDVTPLALLFNEYPVFSVAAGSPLKSARDLVAALKSHPESLSIGVGSSRTGANAVAIGLATALAGGNAKALKIVTFKSSTEATTQMLGGHLALVVNSPSIIMGGLKSGRIRALATVSPERLSGALAGVPTMKELGYDVVVGNWRALIGPRGLQPGALAYWNAVMQQVVAAPLWKAQLARIDAVPEYRNAADTQRFFEAQDALFRHAFEQLGFLEKASR
jgi:putative tricarboxylic transport membrane protein